VASHRGVVMVVDDTETLREQIRSMLSDKGYEVLPFDRVDRAMHEFHRRPGKKQRVDLVIIDLLVARDGAAPSGSDFLDEIVSGRTQCEVIITTSELGSDLFWRFAMRGAGDCLAKPFALEDLLDAVDDLVSRAQMRRRYYDEHLNPVFPASRDVFLSYCVDDTRIASGLRRVVDRSGASVFYSHDHVLPGDPWKAVLKRGLDTCHVFVALLTKSALTSSWMASEIRRALERMSVEGDRLRVIPVLYELPKEAIPVDLQAFQVADMTPRPGVASDMQFLLSSIELHLEMVNGRRKTCPVCGR